MTSYSVLPSGSGASVIATWPAASCDYSVKVTTLAQIDVAEALAYMLSRLSEDAWDAAAWLDVAPAIEAGVSELVDQLRSQVDKIDGITLSPSGWRHVDEPSFTDVEELLELELPAAMNALTRAQRLAVADEIAADAAGRSKALQVLSTGCEPADTARGWQICEVT